MEGPPFVKQLEKIPSVFGGHLISMNITPRKEDGYCIYSLRVGGILHQVKGRSLPLLRLDVRTLPLLGFVIYICLGSWYTLPLALWWVNMWGLTQLPPCRRPLILGMPAPWGITLHFHTSWQIDTHWGHMMTVVWPCGDEVGFALDWPCK